ncbi:hypothetical protein J4573_07540 [Actinomadura barringtoniae]|uniref:DUF2269 family protein n=1 Tax=Actinomadura barringtoniae TaxID=1427535 RepID=A0A939PC58_9ACTN|nr:hypothetical protein [Actinomadura barringtoniae]MBO2446939.1 hypothetical protein [Actinomadura barringtoniae]
MSNSDRLLLILHIGFAIFTLGPLTAATMSTPRYIRKQNVVVLRYLHRTSQIYGVGTLGIFLFGLFLAHGKFGKFWLSASMTLFVVALVLLLLIDRDQRKAVNLLDVAAAEAAPVAPVAVVPAKEAEEEQAEGKDRDKEKDEAPQAAAEQPALDTGVAQVERGRIASMSGVVALIWLVILVLMVWNR